LTLNCYIQKYMGVLSVFFIRLDLLLKTNYNISTDVLVQNLMKDLNQFQ